MSHASCARAGWRHGAAVDRRLVIKAGSGRFADCLVAGRSGAGLAPVLARATPASRMLSQENKAL